MKKIAAIQMCSSDKVDENLQNAKIFIEEAAKNGARLIVLPEMFAIMGKTPNDKVTIKEKSGQGKIQNFLSTLSKKYKVWIIGGTIPVESDDPNKVRASCLVFNDKGVNVARYDKIHLFDVTLSPTEKYTESQTTEAGDEIVALETPFGKIGLAVCYDIRFPELFNCLIQKGVEIIVLPTAFTVNTGKAHWEILARSTALYNFCYFVGACQGGLHPNGRETYGHSLIVEPWGKIVAEKKDDSPGIIYADIDLDNVNQARKIIPVFTHKKV